MNSTLRDGLRCSVTTQFAQKPLWVCPLVLFILYKSFHFIKNSLLSTSSLLHRNSVIRIIPHLSYLTWCSAFVIVMSSTSSAGHYALPQSCRRAHSTTWLQLLLQRILIMLASRCWDVTCIVVWNATLLSTTCILKYHLRESSNIDSKLDTKNRPNYTPQIKLN